MSRGFAARFALAVSLASAGASASLTQPPAPPAPSSAPPDREAPIQCEFRVFDGEDEVTADSSVRMFPTGTRNDGIQVGTSEGRLVVHVPPAIYDAQVIRLKQGQVSNIRWSERLVVMRYPDENGRHLEVVNFRPRFGALQVIARGGAEFDMAAFAPASPATPDSERRPVGRIVKGVGYQLLVAPAGRYDVRIRTAGNDAGERWLLDVEIPSDRTRLKTSDAL